MYCDSLKKKNLLDFCENLLENLLKSPKKSKSKSALTPDLVTSSIQRRSGMAIENRLCMDAPAAMC